MRQTVGIHLHVHYEDVAFRIIEKLRVIRSDYTLFVTASVPLSTNLYREICGLNAPKHILAVENIGRDIQPFLYVLASPLLEKFDVVCKLHTKKGVTGFGSAWLDVCLESMIGDGQAFSKIVTAFGRANAPALVGPKKLYKSANKFDFGNNQNVAKITGAIFGKSFSAEYGFFAGTMFFAKRSIFDELAAALPALLIGLAGLKFEQEPIGNNGGLPHAMERVFGLIPCLKQESVGLLNTDGSLTVHLAPGPVDTSSMVPMFANESMFQDISRAPMFCPIFVCGSHPLTGDWEQIATQTMNDNGVASWEGLSEGRVPRFWKYPDPL